MNDLDSGTGPILVLGGTGKTGRRVAQLLAQSGQRTRIGSRTSERPFDWEDRSTWPAALEGATAAYVTYQPDLAVPRALPAVQALFKLALDQGVTRLVLLSGRGEEEAQQAEDALRATDADWTILRSSWFCQNFSEGFFRDPILAGEFVLPAGLAAEPFVDVDDIAQMAFLALTQPGHAGRLYEVTGPQAITFAEAVAHIGHASGRRVRFVEVPPEDYRITLTRQGVPADYIELVMYLFTTVLDGRNTPLGDGVERALGRKPGSFADFVRRAAADGVWAGRHV